MRIGNARLANGRTVDLEVTDGVITAITTAGADAATEPNASAAGSPGVTTTDLGGWLVLPPLVEPHAHLDKALTADAVPNPRGDLAGAIDAWIAAAAAGMFTHDDMVTRIRAALDRLLLSGVTAVRTHLNCGSGAGIGHLLAAQEAIGEYEGLVDVQTVALPMSPISGSEGAPNRHALAEMIEAGVDLVGGCPHLEPDGDGCISVLLDAASDAGLPLDLHVDETLDPDMLTLRSLAMAVRDRGVERVTASHCVSLGVQPVAVQASVAREVADAGIGIVALPQTNLFLQGRDHPASMPRGLTAIAALREAGVAVAAGADNVQDPFNPVGRSDPLETAALLVMAGHVLPDDAFRMISTASRGLLGLPAASLAVGDRADFVAIDAPSVRGAIADAPAERKVVRAGRVVASTSVARTIHRGDA